MSRYRFEVETGPSVQHSGGIVPRQPMSLVDRLAHMYDRTQQARVIVRGEGSGRFSGGALGSARDATFTEKVDVITGQSVVETHPFDQDWATQRAERADRKAAAKEARRGTRDARNSR